MTGKTTLLAVLLAAVACGQNGGQKTSDLGGARLQYEPQVNEVETVILRKTDFKRQIVSNGKLTAKSRTTLRFVSSGELAEVNCINGDRVKEGFLIAELASESQQIALESARIALRRQELSLYDELAGMGYPAGDTISVPREVLSLAKTRSGYEASLNSLRRAEYDYSRCFLHAPFAGKVADIRLSRHATAGTDAFCTLIDDSVLDVNFSVLESEYSFIETGLEVKVIPYADETVSVRGRVTAINPTVDKNGQIQVTASVKNPGRLLDGMNVKVIVEKTVSGQLVVPKSAVLIRDNMDVLFCHRDGKARWTYINILMTNSESCAVTANRDRGAELDEGDEIIISGNLNLAEGSSVKVKN